MRGTYDSFKVGVGKLSAPAQLDMLDIEIEMRGLSTLLGSATDASGL